jgi:hypothetical protein
VGHTARYIYKTRTIYGDLSTTFSNIENIFTFKAEYLTINFHLNRFREASKAKFSPFEQVRRAKIVGTTQRNRGVLKANAPQQNPVVMALHPADFVDSKKVLNDKALT